MSGHQWPEPHPVLLKFHAGCSVEAVCRAIGLTERELFAPEGVKDLREWVAAKEIDLSDLAACEACGREILAALSSIAVTVAPGDAILAWNDSEPAEGEAKRSQADVLIELLEAGESDSRVDLFHTPDEYEGYATVTLNGHRDTWPIKSRGVRHWLTWQFYQRFGKVPGSQALQDALNVIMGKAVHDGPSHGVSVRLAECAGEIWLDLGNSDHEAVQITTQG